MRLQIDNKKGFFKGSTSSLLQNIIIYSIYKGFIAAKGKLSLKILTAIVFIRIW